MISSENSLQIQKLLSDININLNNFSIKPTRLGKNNRTYLVFTTGKKYLAKFYFSSPNDSRTRLSNEFSFLEYLNKIGIKNAPEARWQRSTQQNRTPCKLRIARMD